MRSHFGWLVPVIVLVASAACNGLITPGSDDGGRDDGSVEPAEASDAPSPTTPDASGPMCVPLFPDAGWPYTVTDAGVATALGCLPTGNPDPWAIASDGTNVYWTYVDDLSPATPPPKGEVVRCSVDGCGNAPTVLASGQDMPTAVAVDANNVYWSNSGAVSGTASIMKCAVGGCGGKPTVLATETSPQQWFGSIAVNASSVYWIEYNAGSVMKCAIAGCAGKPTVLASGESGPVSIAVDDTNVYWADFAGSIRKCAANGCGGNPTTLVAGGQPTHVATDGIDVYWTDNYGTVQRCSASGCGNNPTVLASGQDEPGGIAIDATHVYWTNILGQTVVRCPIAGCSGSPEELIAYQWNPENIALAPNKVFWTDFGMGNVLALSLK